MQRLAFFDFDGTLGDTETAFDQWADRAGERHTEELGARGGVPPEEAAREGRRLTGTMSQVAHNLSALHLSTLDEFFAEVGRQYGEPELARDLETHFEAEFPATVDCYPGVLDGLTRLRDAGWTIGVVTNGPTQRQRLKILHTGVADHVDAWVISEEVGVAKPHRRIFELAAQACGADLAGGGWMVGDSLSADIAGGAGVGLRTAWIVGGNNHLLGSAGGVESARARLDQLVAERDAVAVPDHVLNTTLEAIELMLGGG